MLAHHTAGVGVSPAVGGADDTVGSSNSAGISIPDDEHLKGREIVGSTKPRAYVGYGRLVFDAPTLARAARYGR
jgi:hypothetical protein